MPDKPRYRYRIWNNNGVFLYEVQHGTDYIAGALSDTSETRYPDYGSAVLAAMDVINHHKRMHEHARTRDEAAWHEIP